MNRIQPLQAASLSGSLTSAGDPVQAGVFSPVRSRSQYAWFSPIHYEPNYAYPLLVWLHGEQSSPEQLKRIMPLVSMRNYVAVAPAIPQDGVAEAKSRGWGSTAADVTLAEQCTLDCIGQAHAKYNLHARRVFLAGFGSGGTMALRLALSHPDRFAGALSLCGEFPRGRMPLNRLDEVRQVPLLLACGTASAVYPTEQVCSDLRLLHAAGMHITLRQYCCGHELTPAMLADMDRWMMEQILEPSAATKSQE
jgi:phospholipase/carboxylesterase